jgi:uncharacterized protein
LLIKKTRKYFEKHLDLIFQTKSSPHSIALGFALGTFIGILPTPGISLLLAIIIIFIFKRISKYSLIGAILLWNPLVQSPIYALSYKLGKLIYRNRPIVEYQVTIYKQVYEYTLRYLTGNLILAITISILCYFLVFGLVKLINRKRFKNNPLNYN